MRICTGPRSRNDARGLGGRPTAQYPCGMTLEELLPLLIPLVLIQLVLMALALRDLLREDRQVRGASKGIWAVIIVFGQLVGPLVYLAFGRRDE